MRADFRQRARRLPLSQRSPGAPSHSSRPCLVAVPHSYALSLSRTLNCTCALSLSLSRALDYPCARSFSYARARGIYRCRIDRCSSAHACWHLVELSSLHVCVCVCAVLLPTSTRSCSQLFFSAMVLYFGVSFLCLLVYNSVCFFS